MKKRSTGLSFSILSVILPLLAAAQSNPRLPPIDPAFRIIGANPFFATNGPNITVARVPFQAKRVGRSVQKLADGSTVAEDIVGRIARDSDGRVRVDEQQGDQPLVTEVLDPVTNTSLRWSSSSTTATQSTPFSRQPWHVTFPSQTLSASIESNTEEREPDKITKENLGTKTVKGLVTSGTRTTTVVSAGKIVREVWFSEDLQVAVLDSFTDPKGSERTIEIQEVSRSEPDPTLFQAPQGYTVKQLPGILGGTGGGVMGGLLGGIGQGVPTLSKPPAPPSRVRASGEVQAAKIISQPQPIYGPVARQARVTGIVVLHAIIGKDGTVSELEVVSGNPLLVQAALDAVKQWRYKPTLFLDKPVEVDTTISVPFVLDDKP
jgi:TonB family protein